MHTQIKSKYYVTAAGLEGLKQQLTKYKNNRQQLARELKETNSGSDETELAEILNQQQDIEQKIYDTETTINKATVIEEPTDSNQVVIGSKVKVSRNGNQVVYTMVGELEANPVQGNISTESPLGEALLGKNPGQTVQVYLPDSERTLEYKIVEIK